jgi:DNA adenine methylase
VSIDTFSCSDYLPDSNDVVADKAVTVEEEAMKKMVLTRYPGGKSRLVPWIVGHMPEHRRYVEAYGGAINVLLGKQPAEEEFVIEKDLGMATLIRVVQKHVREFATRMSRLTYHRRIFEEAKGRLRSEDWASEMDLAGLVYVVRRQSIGGQGGSYSHSATKDQAKWWRNGVSTLAAISERLGRVEVLNGDALEWLDLLDDHHTLTYADPPYVHGTRTCLSLYSHEMSDRGHRRLLRLLGDLNGMVLVSGYDNLIYRYGLEGWDFDTRDVRLHAALAEKKTLRTEVLWANYELSPQETRTSIATAA